MKKQLLLLSFITMPVLMLSAQRIMAVTNPEGTGFSGQRLQKLDKAMTEWAQKEWMNGGVALIMRNGKIAYYKAAGYNDLETKTPLKKEAIFRIASQTKAITSVAIMMLFEDGKLLLNQHLR